MRGGGEGGSSPPSLDLFPKPPRPLTPLWSARAPGSLWPCLLGTHLAAAVPAKPLSWGASAPSAAPPARTGLHVGLGVRGH